MPRRLPPPALRRVDADVFFEPEGLIAVGRFVESVPGVVPRDALGLAAGGLETLGVFDGDEPVGAACLEEQDRRRRPPDKPNRLDGQHGLKPGFALCG